MAAVTFEILAGHDAQRGHFTVVITLFDRSLF